MAVETAPVTDSQRQRLEYIERMCQELARMADGSGHKLLAYLLEMAREEAEALQLAPDRMLRPASSIGLRAPRQRSS